MWYDLEHTEGCESLPSLQEPAAESLAERCSDAEPSVPSKSRSIRATSSCNGSETESSNRSPSGTTCVRLTESRGAERSTSSAEVSPARTSAAQGEGSALSEGSEAVCGESMPGSFARYDRATASWKTHQCLLLGGLESFSETWPRSGIMLRGRCYQLATVAHRTNGRGCGSLQKIPTPTVNGNYNRKGLSKKSGDGLATFVKKWPTPQSRDFKIGMASRVERSWRNLNDWAAKFPTPCRTDYKGAGKTGTCRDRLVREGKMTDKERHQIGAGNGGKLNPDWVEWLMGFPIGWTDLKQSEMPKFRSWLRQHSADLNKY